MFVAFALAVALGGGDAAKDTCAKLAKEFDQNERLMAVAHDFLQSNYELDRSFAEKVGNSMDWARVAASREKIRRSDEEFLANGDRITTLLLANKCPPPDHVTSWYTYSEKNPNRKQPPEQASGGE